MKLDYVSGVPDSGTPHAIGYANTSGIPFARPFIKYTPTWPRSFMPNSQKAVSYTHLDAAAADQRAARRASANLSQNINRSEMPEMITMR